MRRVWVPVFFVCSIAACSSEEDGEDAGRPDSGVEQDAGTATDTGVDAGRPDGSGPLDIGPGEDGGPDEDGGSRDTGGADAGGGGTFTERLIDGTGVHGQGAEILDFEGDGDLDVVVAFSLTDTIRIYLNDGSANFTAAQPMPDDSIVAMHAAAADFDGDGDRDLAVLGLFDRAVGFASQGEVTWFENPGDPQGSWTRHDITGLTFWYPLFVRAGDLTGDGRPDLVVASIDIGGNGNGVFWFRNTGGGFTQPIPIEADLPYASTALIHDVDGDGVLDVLASAYNGDELVWYENDRTGPDDDPTFTRHTIATPPAPYGMELADMDGDPALEVIATGDNGNGGQIAWYDPPADPTGQWTEHLVSEEYGAGESSRVHAADLDGDGLTDVALSSLAGSEVRVFFADGTGDFTPSLVMDGHSGANWVTLGDLDRDGRVDLVTTTYDYPGGDRISWWDNEP